MDSLEALNTTRVYTQLRDDIVRGRLAPGQRLIAQRIATQAKVSRTPVKEALARLESEGLVLREENYGYSVRSVSVRDAEEIFEGRLIIEVAAARLAAERATAEDKDALTRLLATSHKRLRSGKLVDFQVDARAVHERVAQAAGNSQVLRMFRQLNDLVLIFGLSLLKANPGRAAEIYTENETIVTAIHGRRSDEAATLMRKHIERGHASFRDAIGTAHSPVRMF
jgi:GntR family transcriptional regulator of vanillate catabolism